MRPPSPDTLRPLLRANPFPASLVPCVGPTEDQDCCGTAFPQPPLSPRPLERPSLNRTRPFPPPCFVLSLTRLAVPSLKGLPGTRWVQLKLFESKRTCASETLQQSSSSALGGVHQIFEIGECYANRIEETWYSFRFKADGAFQAFFGPDCSGYLTTEVSLTLYPPTTRTAGPASTPASTCATATAPARAA